MMVDRDSNAPRDTRPEHPNEPVCSFCGKGRDKVCKLIAGPKVHICDECIELCNDIVAEEYESAVEVKPERPTGDVPPCGRLRPLSSTDADRRTRADSRAWLSLCRLSRGCTPRTADEPQTSEGNRPVSGMGGQDNSTRAMVAR